MAAAKLPRSVSAKNTIRCSVRIHLPTFQHSRLMLETHKVVVSTFLTNLLPLVVNRLKFSNK